MILVAQAPFVVVNLIPGVVQALLALFTLLMVGLIYYAGLARDDRETAAGRAAALRGRTDLDRLTGAPIVAGMGETIEAEAAEGVAEAYLTGAASDRASCSSST